MKAQKHFEDWSKVVIPISEFSYDRLPVKQRLGIVIPNTSDYNAEYVRVFYITGARIIQLPKNILKKYL
jgi:hypothetical protein